MRQGNTKDQCSQKKYDVTQQEEARVTPVNPKAFMENWYIYPELNMYTVYMGASKNRGTPKWMVYNGKPYQNGLFGGTTIFGNIHIYHDHGSYGYYH